MKLFGLEIMSTSEKKELLAKAAKPRRSGGRLMQLFFDRGASTGSSDVDVKYFVQEGYQKCPPVFSIVNNIAEGVGKAKWCVKNAKGEEVEVPLLNKSVGGAVALMEMANSLESWQDFQISSTVHELLEGNTFISGDFGDNGKPYSLFTIPTDGMHIFGDFRKKTITEYRSDFNWANNLTIPASEMLHIKYPNPDWTDGNSIMFGQSAFEPARLSIEAYIESLEAGVFFLNNKGSQKLIYNKMEEYDLGIEGEDTMRDSIRSSDQGLSNNGSIGFIDNADLGVIDISSDPQRALVLEQRHQAALEICNVINYPPEKLGLNNATYQNAKYSEKGFWEHCVIPILERRKAGLQRFIMPRFGEGLYIDYSLDHVDALQEDKLLRGKAIKEFAGMITINQARKLAGMREYDWMKEPTSMDEFQEQVYVGFTQAVVTDQEEISDINNEENNQDEGTDSENE